MRSQAEIDALYKLKECRHAPTLLACKHDKQDADGPFQGGYITYLLMTKVPGDKLGTCLTFEYKKNDLFWKMGYDQREKIRQAFKTAWEYVPLLSVDSPRTVHMLMYYHLDQFRAFAEAGAIPSKSGLDRLFWEKDTETV